MRKIIQRLVYKKIYIYTASDHQNNVLPQNISFNSIFSENVCSLYIAFVLLENRTKTLFKNNFWD